MKKCFVCLSPECEHHTLTPLPLPPLSEFEINPLSLSSKICDSLPMYANTAEYFIDRCVWSFPFCTDSFIVENLEHGNESTTSAMKYRIPIRIKIAVDNTSKIGSPKNSNVRSEKTAGVNFVISCKFN